ncbi:hypothetical protein OG339_06635 [Streptosporangium sp. NBC_01495]|uniref:hypothetical protein n=1 Tax=Streptosporangium sp. NBC_01495 TaxID=2903899 RepID=UPI002E30716F|nr:hypothetical protein [Streptosporangium sp. NBC_01495]
MTGAVLRKLLLRLREAAEKGATADADLLLWDKVIAHPDRLSLGRQRWIEACDDAAAVFAARYRRTGLREFLEKAIAVYEFAAEGADATVWRDPVLLSGLAGRLRDRYSDSGRLDDLERALDLAGQAVSETPQDAPRLAARLNALGGMLRLKYKADGGLPHLQRAIANFRRAIATAESDPERATFHSNLAVALSERYERTGEPADLDSAIAEIEQAVRETPADSPDRVTYLGNLGVFLSDRYDRTGDLSDLDSALEVIMEAVGEADADVAETARLHSNAAILWLDRYERTGSPLQLDMSIRSAVAAVELTPPEAAELPGYLNNLGNARRMRFEHLAEVSIDAIGDSATTDIEVGDLLVAVEAYQRAIELTPAGSPHLPKFLTNLGNSLMDRGSVMASAEDLDRAVGIFDQAVTATLPGSPDLPSRLNNLATGLRFRHSRTGLAADRRRAVETYRDSCRLGLESSVETALAAAQNWGLWATERRSWAEAVEAYELALQAARQLYRLQLSRVYKQTWLVSSDGLTAAAAFADVMVGEFAAAVVALEGGRAMLMADALDRDRADLADLHAQRPLLAERYILAAERVRSLEHLT